MDPNRPIVGLRGAEWRKGKAVLFYSTIYHFRYSTLPLQMGKEWSFRKSGAK
jgi:hypothetical protein